MSSEKIIVALDTATLPEVRRLITALPRAIHFKVGLLAFLQFGPEIVAELQKHGKKIFLDLKFKDIPQTVHGAVTSVLRFRPNFLTVHLSGGAEMIRRALDAAQALPQLTLLGVTLLTSLAGTDLTETGITLSAEDYVLRLVELGLKNGLRGIVCSPREIESIRRRFGPSVLLVTPGIRPTWSQSDDQKRVFTPKMALDAGSDFLVVGRPIIRHPEPDRAFDLIVSELL